MDCLWSKSADVEDPGMVGRLTGALFQAENFGAPYRELLAKGVHFPAPPKSWARVGFLRISRILLTMRCAGVPGRGI